VNFNPVAFLKTLQKWKTLAPEARGNDGERERFHFVLLDVFARFLHERRLGILPFQDKLVN
jgi:hypothetical protein